MIKCENLTKIYRQGDRNIRAVDNCCITVERGEFAAVVGTSGSGKSTLLHLMAAFTRPTSGSVKLGGSDIFAANDIELSRLRNEKIGFVFQNYRLLPILTARENILMPSLLGKKRYSSEHFEELTEILGISDRLHHLPSELSGGQQQRTAIARALINRPEILLADEPTGNLDSESASEVVGYLIRLREKYALTMVIVTHDREIASKADSVYRIKDGAVQRA
nr:ABC transporter ATP-binding protein [Clostridia bacterium]